MSSGMMFFPDAIATVSQAKPARVVRLLGKTQTLRNKIMNKIVKISVLTIGAAMVTQALQAAYSDGDLLVGFASSSSDYVIDLGQIPTTAGTQIGSPISETLFNSTFTSGGVSVGVVAGDNSGSGVFDPTGGDTVWTTTLRAGTAPTSYASAGTEKAPVNTSTTLVDQAAAIPYGLALGVTATTLGGANASWSQGVAVSSTQPGTAHVNWASNLGNPMASLTGPLTLDLWTTTDDNSPNKFTYVGDLQIDMTGSSASVVFDPTAVPEPATYSLLAGGGVLALLLRRNVKRNNA
jgi:hypothetical protein